MITVTFNPTTPEQMAIVTAAMNAYVQADKETINPNWTGDYVRSETQRAIAEAVVEMPKKAKKPPAEKPAAEEPITLEQLRAKMAAKSQAGKGFECKALLARFAATNLTAVPVEQYSDLMTAVEAL